MQLPLFEPSSDWVRPDRLPAIPAGVDIGVDTETKDNGLIAEAAPTWPTKSGYIAGVSVAWGGGSVYAPLRHPDTDNFGEDEVYPWLEAAMRNARRVVFHNAPYDCGWLGNHLEIPYDRIEDTQFMSVMLDENELAYDLGSCCSRAGVPGKDEAKLREAAAAFGIDPKKDMWRLPAKYVGSYAATDASSTLGLFRALLPKLVEQDVEKAYRLEVALVPMFRAMRARGIRIDEDAAESTQREYRDLRDQKLRWLSDEVAVGRKLSIDDINSPAMLERIFDTAGVQYPRTPKTKRGSFSKKGWMGASKHWLPQTIVQIREMHDLAEKFIGTYIMDWSHLGRVHADIHQLRDEDSGTRTYRLSYSSPPLQQVPARTKMGLRIRNIFLSEPDTLWGAADYSQQEPRLAVHFAQLCKIAGASDAVNYYTNDPSADFHQMVAEMTGLTRKQAKIINLGLMYGMGLAKLAHDLGVSIDEAKDIIRQYNERMPFVQGLSVFCSQRVQQRGYIRLLDGARSRFDLWELGGRRDDIPADVARAFTGPLPRDKALQAAKGLKIRRAMAHKAMNRLIQGSAARQTKMAMLACYREGILPLLQMHDELDFPFESPRVGERASQIMSEVVRLEVPMKVDLQYGHNWGQAAEEMDKGVEAPSFEELVALGPALTNQEILQRRAA